MIVIENEDLYCIILGTCIYIYTRNSSSLLADAINNLSDLNVSF